MKRMRARPWSLAVAACGLLLAWVSLASAQAPGAPDPRDSRTVLRPTAQPVVRRTLPFTAAEGASAQLDLYYDAAVAGPRPTLVLVSGTEDPRDWGGYRDFGKLAAQRGFAAVIPTKRFPRGADGARQGRDDTRALLDVIAKLAPEVIDHDRLCIWAFSAGGSTLSAVYAKGAPHIACVIGYYPVLSLRPLGAKDPQWLSQYSPAEVLAAHDSGPTPPTLLVRAGRDGAGINEGIELFASSALQRNLPLTLINLPDARHAFDWFDDQPWSRETIEASFDYARRWTRKADDGSK